MSTDGTGIEPRRAPLPPSARSAGAIGGSTRRPSNRPPPKSLFNGPPDPAAREPARAIPRPAAAALPASATAPSAADDARAVRDDLVRIVMPEVRALVEHLVKTTVERSVASLLDGQRELEAKLERVATSLDKQHALTASAASAARPALDERRELEAAIQRALLPLLEKQRDLAATRAAPVLPAVGAAPRPIAAKPPAAAFALAPDANTVWDIPNELNGSRRKRAVIWILAIAVVLLLLSVAGLSVLSNTGRYL